jgi:GNAT superfamily N-acetyltransferase
MGLLCAQVAERWLVIDRLLPVPGLLDAGCGALFTVALPDGSLAAAASCTHWEGEPGSLETTWGAARQHELTVRAAGENSSAALDVLLSQWRKHLATVPGADEVDSSAVVTWPSRDVAGAVPLLRHGFSPYAVIAARVTEVADEAARGGVRPSPAVPSARPKFHVRRANPADLDAVVRLGLDVVRYDANFGGVVERPWTAAALEREMAELLAAPQPWVWLAILGGAPVGMLAAEPPGAADWIGHRTTLSPVAYLLLMGVRGGDRGRGIGAAMAAELSDQVRAAGVPVTLLHYAQVNPLSAPFWSQQGYRPLWTCWEARPAAHSS